MPIFRRIHGHVVPIKLSEEQKAGVGMIGTGGAVALAAGYTAGKMEYKAAHAFNVGHMMRKKWVMAKADAAGLKAVGKGVAASTATRSAGQFKRLAAKNLLEHKMLHTNMRSVKTVGQVVTGSLVAGGIHKLLPQKVKDNPTADAASTVAGGLASAFLVRTSSYRGVLNHIPFKSAMKLAFERVKARGFRV